MQFALSGLPSLQSFNASLFQQALMAQFQLPTSAYVTIAPAIASRRRLASVNVNVNTTLYSTSQQQATDVVAAIHALSLAPASLTALLLAAGLPPGTQCAGVLLLNIDGGCDMSPCHAGALCTDVDSSYTCACPAGTAGDGFSAACVACGPLAAPTASINVQNGTLAFSAPARFQATQPLPAGTPDGINPCNFSAAYTWRVSNAAGAIMPLASTSQVLAIDARTLPVAGSPYAVTVVTCFQNNAANCSPRSAPVAITTVATPLVAAISGGNSAYQASTTATLDGSASVDPDDPSGTVPLAYAWRCFVGANTSTPCSIAVTTSAVLSLSSALQFLSPGAYTFQLTVTKDIRVASALTAVTLEATSVRPHPTVSIAAIAQSVYLDPASSLTLSATATPFNAADAVSLRWSISPFSAANATALGAGVLDDPCVAAQTSSSCTVASTATTSPTFVLVPGALTANGGTYTLRATATEAGSTSWADVVLPPLARRPQGGSLALLGASTGVAVTMPFVLNVSGWTAGMLAADLPLSYSIAAASANVTRATLLPFQSSSQPAVNLSVYLPAGTWTLSVLVSSARGAQAVPLAATQSISVSPVSSAQISGAVATSVALAHAGQLSSALQLAAAVSQSTNDFLALSPVFGVLSTVLLGTQPSIDTVTASIAAATLALITNDACELLSPAARDAALPVCAVLAGAVPAVCASGVAQNTLQALSSLSSCVGSSSSSQTAQNALTALVNASQACLSVPGQAPIVLNSSAIAFHVGLEDVSGGGTTAGGLFGTNSSGLSCGAGSIGPLPVAALAESGYNGSAVQVAVQYTSFNPHSDGVSAGPGSYSGAVTLELSGANGHPIAVDDLSAPFPITMPACPTPPCLCSYWDESVNASSADGCVGLPLPLPPGVNASFNASLYQASASRSARLLRILQLSGPLMAGCTATILDCSVVGSSGIAYLNPDDPFNYPAVLCPNGNSTGGAVGLGALHTSEGPPALLVFSGASCEVWKTNNSLQCNWDALSQSFTGSGCVGASQMQCMCTHLTAFSSYAPPTIHVASRSQMLHISPADVLSKARLFVIMVSILFVALHFSALFSALVDRRWRSGLRAELFSDAFGFAGNQEIWCWRLSLSTDPDSGISFGPSLRFAAVVGLPLVRLQLAIPEDLLDLSSVVAEPPPAKTPEEKAAEKARDSRSLMASTALVFALILHLEILGGEETVAGLSEATRLFDSLGEHQFRAHVKMFVEMLGNLTLTHKAAWIDSARLWRFILLRNQRAGFAGGEWEPTPSLAFALLAVDLPEPPPIQPLDDYTEWQAEPSAAAARRVEVSKGAPVFWQRPQRVIQDSGRARNLARDEVTHAELRAELALHGRPVQQQPRYAPVPVLDLDALAFSLPAILNSVPDFLVAAFDDDALALRVWITLLSLSTLETFAVCWADRDSSCTLLDEAEIWIENAVARHKRAGGLSGYSRSAALLQEESSIPESLLAEVIKQARPLATETTVRWKLAHENRLALLRSASQAEGGLWRSYRVLGEAVASLQQRHQTASALLSPMADGLTRVHRAALLVTTLLTALTVQTWLYWSKATSCCGQMRALLDCDPDPLVACRGFTGDCADLRTQFATLAHSNTQATLSATGGPWEWQSSVLGSGLSDFVCKAFPDASNPSDRIYSGLILTAVAIPLHHILGVFLQMSTEPEMNRSWLAMKPIVRNIVKLLRLRRLGGGNWRWRQGGLPFWVVRHLQRFSLQPLKSTLEWMCASLAARYTRHYGFNAAAQRTLAGMPPKEREAAEEVLLRVVARRVAGVLGMTCVYGVWTLCIWFVLAYGISLLGLLGVHTETEFLTSWAVSVGVHSAYQLRFAAQALVIGLISQFGLERLRVAPQHAWLEVWLDSMSVQAACTATASPFAYAKVHMRHFRGVTL